MKYVHSLKTSIKFSALPFHRKSGEHTGVYKITFNGMYFYIGGSTMLRSRLSRWKFDIIRNRVKNKKITDILPTCDKVFFEVLEFVFDKEKVKIREDFYIKNNWSNPLILNRCPSAFDPSGFKLNEHERLERKNRPKHIYTEEEIENCRKKAVDAGLCQRVGKFTIDGILINEYQSIRLAASSVSVSVKILGEIFNGKRKTTRGVTFRKIDTYGHIIQPPIRERKKGWTRTMSLEQKDRSSKLMKSLIKANPEKFSRASKSKQKKIISYNTTGFLKEYDSINIASRELNIKTGNICKVLKGKRKTANGYIFKYAS